MTIGENIQKARKFKGISQEDMANSLGVTRQCVSLWETDQTVPSLDNLQAISKLLNVSLDKLTDPNFVTNDEEQIRAKKNAEYQEKERIRKERNKNIYTKLGLVFAILSVIFSFIPVIGTMFAIGGTVFSSLGYRKDRIDIVNIIALLLSIVFIVGSIVIAAAIDVVL